MPVYPEFKGQIVVVTGCASGIGLAQAQAFLEQGASVFGADQNNSQAIGELKVKYPTTFRFKICDLTKAQQISNWCEWFLSQNQKIDILLNTAGKLDNYQTSLTTTEELWDQIFATNVKSMFLLTNRLLPLMLAQKNGVIINMASIAGLVAGGGGAAYTASKHAIIGYTKQLAYDYAAQGIRVNCLAPGAIDTPMNQADFIENDGQMAQLVAKQTPAKRWANAFEVASLTLFVASPSASYIHGAVIPIDGGWTVQ